MCSLFIYQESLIIISDTENNVLGTLLKVTDKHWMNSKVDEKSFHVEVEKSLSEFIEEISEDMFTPKVNMEFQIVAENGKTDESVNNASQNTLTNETILLDYIPSSPFNSDHSLYRPPSILSESDQSDVIPGKHFSNLQQ